MDDDFFQISGTRRVITNEWNILETLLIKVTSRGNPQKKARVSSNKLCFDTEYRVLENFQILIKEEYGLRDKMHRVFFVYILKLILFYVLNISFIFFTS